MNQIMGLDISRVLGLQALLSLQGETDKSFNYTRTELLRCVILVLNYTSAELLGVCSLALSTENILLH